MHIADNAHFDPVNEFDLNWAKCSILDLLSAYRWGTVVKTASSGGERDLIMLIRRCVDTAFQNIQVQTLRSDQQTQAGSTRAIAEWLTKDGSIKAKVSAVKPNLILTKNCLEFGGSECGFADEGGVGRRN
ncbi:hypothetical protein BJV82DRAFT_669647 [Fennellomyces sp. T-0311]|nr:hypothetical protein BJV82DRAFT_669647 [Fennellomyces sp. T-0311]